MPSTNFNQMNCGIGFSTTTNPDVTADDPPKTLDDMIEGTLDWFATYLPTSFGLGGGFVSESAALQNHQSMLSNNTVQSSKMPIEQYWFPSNANKEPCRDINNSEFDLDSSGSFLMNNPEAKRGNSGYFEWMFGAKGNGQQMSIDDIERQGPPSDLEPRAVISEYEDMDRFLFD